MIWTVFRPPPPETEGPQGTDRAYLTEDDLPLQIVYLHPGVGWRADPHFHPPDSPGPSVSKHQVMVCVSGLARIGVYTRQGEHLTDVDLSPGDLILLCEGHSVEAMQAGTRLIEIRQGPVLRGAPGDLVKLEPGG